MHRAPSAIRRRSPLPGAAAVLGALTLAVAADPPAAPAPAPTATAATADGTRVSVMPVAVRGVDGIRGLRLENLETVLRLQRAPPPPPPPPASAAPAAALRNLPAAPPPPEPPPPTDERHLLNELSPDEIGGS